MTISLFQAFLMGIIYYLGNIGTPWTTVLGSASIFQKPLVAGTLVGLILGHPIHRGRYHRRGDSAALYRVYFRRRNDSF